MDRLNEKPRYGRISSLVDVDILTQKRVVVIGVGSMGQIVVNQLVRHGVASRSPGHIHIVDGDVVDDRNMIGTDYRPEHIGKPKVVAASSIISEIHQGTDVSHWNRNLTEKDIPLVVDLARRSDLIGLFADSFDVMHSIADRCTGVCPMVTSVFGPNAGYAEVAFSVPGATPSLRRTMGGRPRGRISSPSAFGCDTTFIASFAAAVCLELLLAPADRGKVVRCHANAPLFAIGLRRAWIFGRQPEDVSRSVVCVQVSS